MLLIEHLAFGKIFIYLLLLVLIMCGAGICERECRCPQRSKGLDPTETGCEKLAVILGINSGPLKEPPSALSH